MDAVAREVESDPTYRDVIDASRGGPKATVADGIVSAAREIAETTNIKAICCYYETETARRLCLTWGAHCEMVGPQERFKGAVISAVRAALDSGFAEEADQIVVTAGVPFNKAGTTNILRVAPCRESLIYKSEPE